MRCSACGAENQEQDKPCTNCGVVFSRFEATGIIPLSDEDSSNFGQSDSGQTASIDLPDLTSGGAALVVRRGPLEGVRFDLVAKDGQIISVGRSPESSIFLDDVTVSRKHATLARVTGLWTITDTGSLNGTYVNRERVESATLKNGDELQIGKYRFAFLTGEI